ncbi:MAG: hypothetical protein CMJ18_12215 [Phycisphaeraceae bacterium]|nr:hypothetical protein [Phycisphaeraceae bacterium]
MGLAILPKTFDLDEYRGVNYSALLAWKPRPTILQSAAEADYPWLLHLYGKEGPTPAFQQRVRGLLDEYEANVGMLVNDEPTLHGLNNFQQTGEVLAWLRATWPDRLHLSNIGPPGGERRHYYGKIKDPTPEQQQEAGDYSYGQYVRDYIRIARPDVHMYDIYVFNHGEGNESGVTDYWYQSLWVNRRAALAAGLPYWIFVQTWERPAGSRGYNVRLPSESDYRMQVFCALTYGFTGIANFMYCPGHQRDILMPGGDPSPLYEPAARAHAEVARLGRAMRFLTSTNVAHLPGRAGVRIPTYHENWKQGTAGDRRIRSIAILDDGLHRHGLIGHFRDDDGQTYFMVTNLYQHARRNADECAVRVRIVFDPGVKTILRLCRQTGEVERLTILNPDEGLVIHLPGGTGDLFKYDTGGFAGIE